MSPNLDVEPESGRRVDRDVGANKRIDAQTTVAIVLPSNNIAGPQKLSALWARDLAANGFQVEVLVPSLPYWYYYVRLHGGFRNFLRWMRIGINSLWSVFRRGFAFADLAGGCVNYRSVLLPLMPRLSHVDILIVHGIGELIELSPKFPQDRMIYYLHHPEEITHGHAGRLKAVRSDFRGTLIANSPWTRDAVADHVTCTTIIPPAIAPVFYRHVGVDSELNRPRDILLHYSVGRNRGGQHGIDLIDAVLSVRPQTKVTVWTRDQDPGLDGVKVVSDLTDEELCQCYLSHSFLLFPSTFEGAGMPPMEAMACGCIPILKAGVGAADTYASRENAVLLGPEVMTDAESIVDLLNHPPATARMRANVQEALRPFSPTGYGVRLLAGMFEAGNPPCGPVGSVNRNSAQ